MIHRSDAINEKLLAFCNLKIVTVQLNQITIFINIQIVIIKINEIRNIKYSIQRSNLLRYGMFIED